MVIETIFHYNQNNWEGNKMFCIARYKYIKCLILLQYNLHSYNFNIVPQANIQNGLKGEEET